MSIPCILLLTRCSTPTENNIKIADNLENGQIICQKTTAFQDDNISFTVTADQGYLIDKVYCNQEILTADTIGIYNFVMPKKDVVLNATFTAIKHKIVFKNEDGTNLFVFNNFTINNHSLENLTLPTKMGYELEGFYSKTASDEYDAKIFNFNSGISTTLHLNANEYINWEQNSTYTVFAKFTHLVHNITFVQTDGIDFSCEKSSANDYLEENFARNNNAVIISSIEYYEYNRTTPVIF